MVWKITWEIWKIITTALKSLKIGTLIGSFYPKYKMYELKIYRGVMCHNNEEWYNIWGGIDLPFQNRHEQFDEFWPKYSKVSKICTLMGSFWTKYIMFELKKVQRSYASEHWRVMQNLKKNWLAVWEIWQIFIRALKSPKIGRLMGSFYPK